MRNRFDRQLLELNNELVENIYDGNEDFNFLINF